MFFEKITENKAREINPLVLAFTGDAVFSLYVRQKATLTSSAKTGELHKRVTKIVCAQFQAKAYDIIFETASETEQEFMRRGRNQHTINCPKNASIDEYHKATGFETLLGFLYLTGQDDRLCQILNAINI